MRRPTTKLLVLACALLGSSLIYSSASPTLTLFLVGMPYFGLVVVTYQTVAQSLLQQHTPIDKQGRIMSLFALGTMGTTPIGGLLTGWLTDAISPRASLALGGITPLLCAAWLLGSSTLAGSDGGRAGHSSRSIGEGP